MENTQWFSAPVVWFFAGLLIFIFEFANPGFILFFFGLGAWAVSLITLITPLSFAGQLLVFLGISVITLVLLRKRFTRLFQGFLEKKQDPAQNLDDFTGKQAKVISEIIPPGRGKVEFYGSTWLAEAEENIRKGELVEITAKDNIVLKVKKIG